MEFWLLVSGNCEICLEWCPHSKVVSAATNLILNLLVLDNLINAPLEDWDPSRTSESFWIVGEPAKVSQKRSSVVFDCLLECLSHALVPDEGWMAIVVPAVNLEEPLVIIFVKVLEERHRKIPKEDWITKKGWPWALSLRLLLGYLGHLKLLFLALLFIFKDHL